MSESWRINRYTLSVENNVEICSLQAILLLGKTLQIKVEGVLVANLSSS